MICSSFTFSATVNPIKYLGANPILIDSEPDSWNMCPDLLELAIKEGIAINKKPKAIIVSGYFNPLHKGHIELFEKASIIGALRAPGHIHTSETLNCSNKLIIRLN